MNSNSPRTTMSPKTICLFAAISVTWRCEKICLVVDVIVPDSQLRRTGIISQLVATTEWRNHSVSANPSKWWGESEESWEQFLEMNQLGIWFAGE